MHAFLEFTHEQDAREVFERLYQADIPRMIMFDDSRETWEIIVKFDDIGRIVVINIQTLGIRAGKLIIPPKSNEEENT